MSTGPVLFIRRATSADGEMIQQLIAAAPEAAQWPLSVFASYFAAPEESSFSAHTIFVASIRRACAQLVIGFAAFSAVMVPGGAECELSNMAVAPSWRRQGIGRRLLTAGMLWCRTWQAPALRCEGDFRPTMLIREQKLRLEVRFSNQAAIRLYESAGFRISGCRPGYYSNPAEDAILMESAG